MYEFNNILTVIGTICVGVTISRYYTGVINHIKTDHENSVININNQLDTLSLDFQNKLEIIDSKIVQVNNRISSLDYVDDINGKIKDINKNISFLNNIVEASTTKLDNDTMDNSENSREKKWFLF